jgi:hypothetical protein
MESFQGNGVDNVCDADMAMYRTSTITYSRHLEQKHLEQQLKAPRRHGRWHPKICARQSTLNELIKKTLYGDNAGHLKIVDGHWQQPYLRVVQQPRSHRLT